MSTTPTQGERIWGGTTLADRQATRRTRLMEVGLDLLADPSPTALSVRAVCRAAQLTERYFYESFPDRDALVVAVYEQLADEVRAALEEATGSVAAPIDAAQTAIEALMRLTVDDPRKGRVLLVSPLTEPALADASLALGPALISIIRDQLPKKTPQAERDLIAVGLLGSLMSLFYVYLQGKMKVTRAEFVTHCVTVLRHAGHLTSES